jgi:hypothetical protein
MAFHEAGGYLQVGEIEVPVDIDIGVPFRLTDADKEGLVLGIVVEDCVVFNDLLPVHLQLLLGGAGSMHPRPHDDLDILLSYSLGFQQT